MLWFTLKKWWRTQSVSCPGTQADHETVANVPAGLALQLRGEPRSQGPLPGPPTRKGPAGGLRRGGCCPESRPGGERATAPGRDSQARSPWPGAPGLGTRWGPHFLAHRGNRGEGEIGVLEGTGVQLCPPSPRPGLGGLCQSHSLLRPGTPPRRPPSLPHSSPPSHTCLPGTGHELGRGPRSSGSLPLRPTPVAALLCGVSR